MSETSYRKCPKYCAAHLWMRIISFRCCFRKFALSVNSYLKFNYHHWLLFHKPLLKWLTEVHFTAPSSCGRCRRMTTVAHVSFLFNPYLSTGAGSLICPFWFWPLVTFTHAYYVFCISTMFPSSTKIEECWEQKNLYFIT